MFQNSDLISIENDFILLCADFPASKNIPGKINTVYVNCTSSMSRLLGTIFSLGYSWA